MTGYRAIESMPNHIECESVCLFGVVGTQKGWHMALLRGLSKVEQCDYQESIFDACS
jgi:hypothetical protein